jgi:osmotically-inducible protein OsmY
MNQQKCISSFFRQFFLYVIATLFLTTSSIAQESARRIADSIVESVRARSIGKYSLEVEVGGNAFRSSELKKGEVRLRGQVNSIENFNTVEEIARKTDGVTSVYNELEIIPELKGHELNKIELSGTASSILEKIKTLPGLRLYSLKVYTEGKNIFVQGEVDSRRDKDSIDKILEPYTSEYIVHNTLSFKLEIPDERIRQNIIRALKESRDVNTEGLIITVQKGIATFSGKRKNHREVDQILSIALMVEGVKGIKTEMTYP